MHLTGENGEGIMLKLVNEWLVRALVLLSLATHLILVLEAGSRRRRAIGVRIALPWFSYQVAGWAATHSISNLMLGITTSREQHLHAFWTPFLLMHLALPDNISAYALEDNVLSNRQVAGAPAQVVGAFYVLYKHFMAVSDAGTLGPASYIMFTLGIAKYLESVWALWQCNMGRIRRSVKKMKHEDLIRMMSSADDDQHQGAHDYPIGKDQALLVAHDLLHISKGAFADCSFYWSGDTSGISVIRAFSRSHGWQDMCKVVVMELSLMYDVIYTKAAVVHTWHGYSIRAASPPFTAAALILFWFCNKDGQRSEDVFITYVLLVVTFILDVRWLVGALGSTWTCAFLRHRQSRSCPCWLLVLLQCSLGRWHGLIRSLVVSVTIKHPTSYRMWPGTIGQYNLLTESSCGRTTGICRKLMKKISMEDSWMEYQYGYSKGFSVSPFVMDLLFQTIREVLKPICKPKQKTLTCDAGSGSDSGSVDDSDMFLPPEDEEAHSISDGHYGSVRARHYEINQGLGLDHEFQEVVLRWHIATDIFLLLRPLSRLEYKYVKTIKVLSNYMMFLVAVRPNMLPGLYLRSMHDATLDDLREMWCRPDAPGNSTTRIRTTTACARDLEGLVKMLQEMEKKTRNDRSVLTDSGIILSDATMYANALDNRLDSNNGRDFFNQYANLSELDKLGKLEKLVPRLWADAKPMEMQMMLEIILDVWVRLLIQASIQCSRGAHAKQLSRGGDLTTIVWILTEHARIFRIPSDN